MATKKKGTFIDIELEWAESQLVSWKAYVDANPLNELKDRIGEKLTAKGGVIPYVISNIENQGKFIQDTMKNYLALLKEVDAMREKEHEKKKSVRGQQSLTPAEQGLI